MSDKSDRRDFFRIDRIAPPLMSSWVRARHVLSVEAVVDVERAILWPDADGEQPVQDNDVKAGCAQEEKGGRTRR